MRIRHFLTPKTRLKLANSNEWIVTKFKNLHFWVLLAKMANFREFLAKMDKTGIFQKSAWNIFSRLQALNNCKVSEKSNERFLRNSVTHKHTNERTDATPKVSTTSWSRDQKVKKLAILQNRL